MNVLLLPGNSSRHGEWIENLKLAVSPYFQRTVTQHYRHWQTGVEMADVDYEIGISQEKVRALEPFCIIAKSIGTAIATKGTATGAFKPERLILLGVPINGAVSKDLLKRWLDEINIPIIIVQNTSDPLGSFAEVKAAFDRAAENVSFVELPGETHDYLDFKAIAKMI